MKLVLITWVDACSAAEWEDPDKVKEWSAQEYEVSEVGWEVCSNEKYTTICSQVGCDGSLGNKTKIPNSWIKEKRGLKCDKKIKRNSCTSLKPRHKKLTG